MLYLIFQNNLMGQLQEIFDNIFFHDSKSIGHTSHGLKHLYVQIFLSIFKFKNIRTVLSSIKTLFSSQGPEHRSCAFYFIYNMILLYHFCNIQYRRKLVTLLFSVSL